MRYRHRPIIIHPEWHLFSGLKGLYLHTLLRDIGRGLVNIFVPIYIYKLTNSLVWPFVLYSIYHLVVVGSIFWIPHIIKKIGIDWSVAVGAILRAMSMLFFILAKNNLLYFGPAFIFWGLLIFFTWIPYDFTIIKSDDGDNKFGRESSLVLIVQNLALVITPAVGGIIVYWFGFSHLYQIAIIFILLSALPMFFDTIKKKNMRFSYPQLKQDFLNPKLRRLNLGLIGEGLEGNSSAVLWPLFMFIYLGKVEKVGIASTLPLLISLVVLFILGRQTDEKGKNWARPFYWLFLLSWLLKPFFRNMVGFVTIDTAYYILVNLAFLVYNSSWYEYVQKGRRLEFLARREVLYHAGAFVSCWLMLIGIKFFNFWLAGFMLASVGVWFMRQLVFSKQNNG